MLSADGTYAIYKVQFRKSPQDDWRTYDTDNLRGSESRPRWVNGVEQNPYHEFSINAQCWKKTSQRGTFDMSSAIDMMGIAAMSHPTWTFRVVRVDITQATTPISAMVMIGSHS